MKTRPLLCLLLLLFVVTNLIAQGDKNSGKVKSSEDKSYFLADVSYINDAVFLGRRDSIAAPYIFPSIGYYDKSGFFADASISYLTGSEENRIDLSLIICSIQRTGAVAFPVPPIFTIRTVTTCNRKL